MDLKVKTNLDYFMKSLSSIFPKYIRKSRNPNITLSSDFLANSSYLLNIEIGYSRLEYSSFSSG